MLVKFIDVSSKIFAKIKDPELGLLVQSAISALLPASSVLPVAFLVATGRAA